ncbi:transposase [Vreelandella janggokensis]|uniref:transposase n=1 Tax=Vreelandella janggokensis TaxID=370767 RepID=UPI003BF5069E
MTRKRRPFTPEFKQEAICLVLDQGYSVAEVSRSLNVGRDESYVLIDQLSELESVQRQPSRIEQSMARR